MTQAEIVENGYQQAVEVGSPRYVSAAVAVAANWVMAGVFLFWAIMGPPIDVGPSPAAFAMARGLLGILVVMLVRGGPVSSGLAWVISTGLAGLGIYAWITKGSPDPMAVWEAVVTGAYAFICPLAVWQTAVQSAQQNPAPSAGEPRLTPSSMQTPVFGRAMASKIADLLEKGETIIQGQKDFCATGLTYVDGRFVYDDMRDGRLACLAQTPPSFDRSLAVFSDRAAFVAWLAGQSDESLAGKKDHRDPWYKTQRITLSHLRAVANDSTHAH